MTTAWICVNHRPVVVERRVVVQRPIIVEHRVVVERPVVVRRPYVDRIRVGEILRVNHYEVIGEPMFVRGHYVVRTHNRFGHVVFVQIDPTAAPSRVKSACNGRPCSTGLGPGSMVCPSP